MSGRKGIQGSRFAVDRRSVPAGWRGKRLHDLCASFQTAVIGWIVDEVFSVCEEKKLRAIVVGGGVSANSLLRHRLMREGRLRGLQVFLPPMLLTTDNASMIARAGYQRYQKGFRSESGLTADPNLDLLLSPS